MIDYNKSNSSWLLRHQLMKVLGMNKSYNNIKIRQKTLIHNQAIKIHNLESPTNFKTNLVHKIVQLLL
jgi:hypothetical protein